MLTIRLQRTGRKHEPTFRVVLTESQNGPKSGKFKEILGFYDPRKTNEAVKADRIKYWMSQGAQVSDTVHNLLINQKVIEGKKINVLPKKTVPAPKTTESGSAKEPKAEDGSAKEAKPDQVEPDLGSPEEPKAEVKTDEVGSPKEETSSPDASEEAVREPTPEPETPSEPEATEPEPKVTGEETKAE